jgi:diguanylate cyclase (GGDEF)-like protein
MNTRPSPSASRRVRTLLLLILSFLLVLFWAWVDFRMGTEVAMSAFYLIPIVLAAWFVHESAGIAVSILGAGLATYNTEVLSGLIYRNFWIGVWAALSRLFFFLVTVWLTGRLRRNMESIRRMAMTDSLTGVYNARAFFDFLQKEVERSRRYQRPLSLMYLDLDNFKSINDTLGHQAGNSVLGGVAGTLKASVRLTDIVARLGGDEFVVLLPETGSDSARTIVERARENVVRDMSTRGWPLTFSAGVTTCWKDFCSADEMIRTADDLMYRVKRSGKNGILYNVSTE